MSSISGSSWLCQRKLLLAFACYCCLLAQTNSVAAHFPHLDENLDALNEKICGLSKGPNEKGGDLEDLKPRMSAGWNAARGEFPWYVRIWAAYRSEKGEFGVPCGGSIIHHNLIMTAADCLDWDGLEPVKITVFAGMIRAAENRSAQIFQAERYCIQEGRGGAPKDLAIIRLEYSIRYNDDVRPICLHDPGHGQGHGAGGHGFETPQFSGCIFSGFGRTDAKDESKFWQGVLRGLSMEFCPREILEEADVNENEFCMVSADKDRYPGNPCIGDSGGGLACLDSRRNDGRYYLAAAATNGPGICEHGKASYALFAQIWKYRSDVLSMYMHCAR